MYDLTVIIPVYNVEKYLRRCLDSIINQTKLSKIAIRVLCINDGSTDNSLSILFEYQEKCPVIEIYSQKNSGLSNVRNVGLKMAGDSRYIVFLDSDDYWEENFLEQFCVVEVNNPDIVFFDINLVDYKRNTVKRLCVNPYSDQVDGDDIKKHYLVVKHSAWSRICKTHLFQGVNFPKGKLYEDLAVMPYIVSKAESIEYIHKPLVNYVVNTPGSIMNSSKSDIFDIYFALRYLFELFGEQFDVYHEELQYLSLEHLCIGHVYRLLTYTDWKISDFESVTDFMEEHFGVHWDKNKYVTQGVPKVNINSILAPLVPQLIFVLKRKWFRLLGVFCKKN